MNRPLKTRTWDDDGPVIMSVYDIALNEIVREADREYVTVGDDKVGRLLILLEITAGKRGLLFNPGSDLGVSRGQLSCLWYYVERQGFPPEPTLMKIVYNWKEVVKRVGCYSGRGLRENSGVINLGSLCKFRVSLLTAFEDFLEQDEP